MQNTSKLLRKNQEELAADIISKKATNSAKKVTAAEAALGKYTEALGGLATAENTLKTKEAELTTVKSKLVDAKKLAEKEIEKYKTYEQYKGNLAELKKAKVDADIEYKAKRNSYFYKRSFARTAYEVRNNINTKVNNSANMDFFVGLRGLHLLKANSVTGSLNINSTGENETYVDGKYSRNYTV